MIKSQREIAPHRHIHIDKNFFASRTQYFSYVVSNLFNKQFSGNPDFRDKLLKYATELQAEILVSDIDKAINGEKTFILPGTQIKSHEKVSGFGITEIEIKRPKAEIPVNDAMPIINIEEEQIDKCDTNKAIDELIKAMPNNAEDKLKKSFNKMSGKKIKYSKEEKKIHINVNNLVKNKKIDKTKKKSNKH